MIQNQGLKITIQSYYLRPTAHTPHKFHIQIAQQSSNCKERTKMGLVQMAQQSPNCKEKTLFQKRRLELGKKWLNLTYIS